MSEPADFVEGRAEVDGETIHYIVTGSGAPVLLVHGAFGRAGDILQTAFGRALSQGRRVIAADSLGHGQSSSPQDPARYGPRPRAAHLAAVLDAVGVRRAHVVGYSMGGWMASALAAWRPDRIASLAIGGWDVVDGMNTPARIWGLPGIDYETLRAMVMKTRPELLAGVRPEREPGLAAAVNAMNDLDGLAASVLACRAPTALWVGREDLYHDAAQRFATAHGLAFIPVDGDHMTVLEAGGAAAALRVGRFIDHAIHAGDSPGVTNDRANRG